MPSEHLITLTSRLGTASGGASPIDYIRQWVQNQWPNLDPTFVYTEPISIAWQRHGSGGHISHSLVSDDPARDSSIVLRALSHYLIDLMPESAMSSVCKSLAEDYYFYYGRTEDQQISALPAGQLRASFGEKRERPSFQIASEE